MQGRDNYVSLRELKRRLEKASRRPAKSKPGKLKRPSRVVKTSGRHS